MSEFEEKPEFEMQRLLRSIAGKADAGETKEVLRRRAIRRMNLDLAGDRQISDRTGRSYWYAEVCDIPSVHMDRARELTRPAPLQGAIDAIDNAEQEIEQFLDGLRRQREVIRDGLIRRFGAGGTSFIAESAGSRARPPKSEAITDGHSKPARTATGSRVFLREKHN